MASIQRQRVATQYQRQVTGREADQIGTYVGNRCQGESEISGEWGSGLLGACAVEEHVEEVDAVVLVAFGGVVALGFEDRDERRVGGEVGAGFADRFELAVELGGSGAVSVAEEFVVELGCEVRHRGGAARG